MPPYSWLLLNMWRLLLILLIIGKRFFIMTAEIGEIATSKNDEIERNAKIQSVIVNDKSNWQILNKPSKPQAGKKVWESLQGPWGKGTVPNNVNSEDSLIDDYTIIDEPQLQMTYLSNADILDYCKNLVNNEHNRSDGGSDGDDIMVTEKKIWQNLNWDKRSNNPTWNNFRGIWGKRPNEWNNLKDLWDKRNNKNWQKLIGGWGKRSQLNCKMN